jgi:hypothetical protein
MQGIISTRVQLAPNKGTHPIEQGCQMVYFHTKNSNLGIFRRSLEWKMLAYFMTLWNVVMSFVIF